MTFSPDFIAKLEAKVTEQLKAQRVGYLLGAGSSWLNGNGYPLASELWDHIKNHIADADKRAEIQAKLDGGAQGIEQALDLLDNGQPVEGPHRHLVTAAIADLFQPLVPPLEWHEKFVGRLGRRSGPAVRIFSLNYDPLVERASERNRVRLVDGFIGHEHAFFNPAVFDEIPMQPRGPRAKATLHPAGISIHLYKLHGSLGWYECPNRGVCRCGFGQSLPSEVTRLMVPLQQRKISEVGRPPYSPLWTAFRGAWSHDAKPLNRLVAIGYGFLDEHVNDVIEFGLSQPDFRLLIFTKHLSEVAWKRWSPKANTVIVTETRSAMYGTFGPGHADLWSFERLAGEV